MANSSSLTSRSAALEAMRALRLALEESSQAAREGELTHTHTHRVVLQKSMQMRSGMPHCAGKMEAISSS